MKPLSPGVVVAVTAALVAAHASSASAADVVLVPASGGVGSEMPDLPQRVTEAIKDVATRHGLVPEIAGGTRDEVLASAGCTEDIDACHQKVMESLGARKLILVHITPGAGGATAAVEIVVATRGKAPVRVGIPLMSEDQDGLLAELRRKAPRAFAAETAGDPEVPENNQTIKSDVRPGEGGSFSAPEGGEKAASKTDTTSPPSAATTPPAGGDDGEGGYDVTRVKDSTWAIAGTSAGVFIVGVIFLNAAGNKEDEVADARANTLEDIRRLEDIESTGKTLNTIGNTGVLLGLAGLGVAGYLIYREAKVPASNSAEVSFAPLISPGGLGVMATVRR